MLVLAEFFNNFIFCDFKDAIVYYTSAVLVCVNVWWRVLMNMDLEKIIFVRCVFY